MEELETEFSKDNCCDCPLAYHLGTRFILKIGESVRPAVASLETSGSGSALIGTSQSAISQSHHGDLGSDVVASGHL